MSYLEVQPAHLYLRVGFSSPTEVFDTINRIGHPNYVLKPKKN